MQHPHTPHPYFDTLLLGRPICQSNHPQWPVEVGLCWKSEGSYNFCGTFKTNNFSVPDGGNAGKLKAARKGTDFSTTIYRQPRMSVLSSKISAQSTESHIGVAFNFAVSVSPLHRFRLLLCGISQSACESNNIFQSHLLSKQFYQVKGQPGLGLLHLVSQL